ncbi:TetR/AcrR family transcriptional regulator [Larsenimonas rhizosphaerae]|uniref:TetR/AcrR family transcriptional regulator n=1 Tax=Larsenimonas rhizosphaerae TaxID=2944682 RepID=A0AA42CTB4_9GAMM|nr:TetR/AcrR family transcriptional regulator [Larsenimonas rhizosphaerae]MCM2130758.1 TetR/AcrR family transcriptional regulator [Larsenimonas rhizosphaerae]MCX2523462.1 TetR/AcrR family transcriptional regulator [Larsenimonas rhizosphaerae]
MTAGSDEQGTSRAKTRLANEQLILDVAEGCFARHGFRGTSVRLIAEEAGLPKSNILYYFSSKLVLYKALLARTMQRWNEQIDDIRVEDDPAEVLSRFIRAKIEQARLHPQASRLFATEMLQGAPFLQDYLGSVGRAWMADKAEVLAVWMDQGRLRRMDPVRLIFLIWASTQHYADFEVQILGVTGKEAQSAEDFDAAADFLCAMILRGCDLIPPSGTITDHLPMLAAQGVHT